MEISREDAVGSYVHEEKEYFFCNPSCLENFRANPSQYLSSGVGASSARPGPNAARPGPNAARPGPNAVRPGPNAVRPGPNAVRPYKARH